MPQNLCLLPFNCSFCAYSVYLNRNIKTKNGGGGDTLFQTENTPFFGGKMRKKRPDFACFFHRKMPCFGGMQLAQRGWKTPWKPLWKCREIAGDCCRNMNTVWTKNVKFRRFTMKIRHCDRHIYQMCEQIFVQLRQGVKISDRILLSIIYKSLVFFIDTLDGRWYNDNV